MELKTYNGQVNYLSISGKDTVKSQMSLECAKKIIKEGKKSKSKKFDGFNLCVNNKFYFETINNNTKNDKTDCKE